MLTQVSKYLCVRIMLAFHFIVRKLAGIQMAVQGFVKMNDGLSIIHGIAFSCPKEMLRN